MSSNDFAFGFLLSAFCNTSLDLAFLLDDSSSIPDQDWTRLLNFVKSVIDSLAIGQNSVRVAIVRYSTTADVVFPLTRFYTANAMKNAIDNIAFNGGSTNLADALRIVLSDVYQVSPRPFAQKSVVLITDGRSNRQEESVIQANYVKSAGIKIVAVGVVPSGVSVGFGELQEIASVPEEVVILQVANYAELPTKAADLMRAYCVLSPVPGGLGLIRGGEVKVVMVRIITIKRRRVDMMMMVVVVVMLVRMILLVRMKMTVQG